MTSTMVVNVMMVHTNYLRISGIYSNEPNVPREPSWISSQLSRSTLAVSSPPEACEHVIKKCRYEKCKTCYIFAFFYHVLTQL